jgi:hypothetical protein
MSCLYFRYLGTWLAAIVIFTFTPFAQAQKNKTEVQSSVQRQIMDLERQMWEAAKRRDEATVRRLLTDDAVDVGEHGIWDKEKSAKSISSLEKHPNSELTGYSLSDRTFRKASDGVIVVCYKAEMTNVSNGQPQIPAVQYVSEVWVRRGHSWLNLLWHGTLEAPKTIRN